jgi:anti-anti-sigma regulatory factor
VTEVGNVITVAAGVLDERDVADLRAAVIAALERGPTVEVDLRAVESMSAEIVRALAECARIGPGIVFRFRGGLGAGGLSYAR